MGWPLAKGLAAFSLAVISAGMACTYTDWWERHPIGGAAAIAAASLAALFAAYIGCCTILTAG